MPQGRPPVRRLKAHVLPPPHTGPCGRPAGWAARVLGASCGEGGGARLCVGPGCWVRDPAMSFVPQRLIDEQLSRKEALYALSFGTTTCALWPDPVDVSAST